MTVNLNFAKVLSLHSRALQCYLALSVSASRMLLTAAEVGSTAACLLAMPAPDPGCGAAASCGRAIAAPRGMKAVTSWGAGRGLAAPGSGGTSRQKARGRMMTGGGPWLGSGEVRDPDDDLLTSWG